MYGVGWCNYSTQHALRTPFYSMSEKILDDATRNAIIQEAIFKPRNALIIGATVFGSFAMPPLAPFIAAGGAAALAGSVGLTWASDKTRNKALVHVMGEGDRKSVV